MDVSRTQFQHYRFRPAKVTKEGYMANDVATGRNNSGYHRNLTKEFLMIRFEAWGYIFLFGSTLLTTLSLTVLMGRWQIAANIVAILLGILSVFILVPMATKN
jgi:hypothetical protein